jgi:HEPN domain-containing protein
MLYSMGSPFVEQMIEGGRLLYMRKATAAWLAEARDDLESAAILLEHGRYRGVCLHSQQCVEKGLKVLLLEKGRRHPRTHDILELLNAARAEGWQLETDIDDAVFLNSVYRGRYPTEDGLLPLGEPQEKDAVKAHSAASGIMARIESFM